MSIALEKNDFCAEIEKVGSHRLKRKVVVMVTKHKVKYTIDMLKEVVERDGCKIDVERFKDLKKETLVKFECKCGVTYEKKARVLVYKGGGFCKSCTFKNRHDKTVMTNLERYGETHPMKNEDIKEKGKFTNLEKYGVESAPQNDEIKDKMRETNILRYGTDCVLKNKSIREKIKKTNLKKYNNEHAIASDTVKSKIKASLLKKYGVTAPFKSKVIKAKAAATNMAKYGVWNTMQDQGFRERLYKKKMDNKKKITS